MSVKIGIKLYFHNQLCLSSFHSNGLLQVDYVEPLLHSSIVGNAAFGTMLNLARCLAPPLCSWAHEIAAALRIVSTKDVNVLWDLIPPVNEGEVHKRSSLSIFEQIVTGLSVSCNTGPLPADSFTFVFPVCFPV